MMLTSSRQLAVRVVVRRHVGVRESGVRERKPRIGGDGLLVIADRLGDGVGIALELVVPAEQVQLVRFDARGLPRLDIEQESAAQGELQRVGNRLRDFLLHRKHIADGAIECFRPEVIAILRIDELRDDADTTIAATYASLEHIACSQRAADNAHILVPVLEGERRSTRRDAQAGDLRECVQQLLGKSIGEVALAPIIGKVRDRQHGDGRRLSFSARGGRGVAMHPRQGRCDSGDDRNDGRRNEQGSSQSSGSSCLLRRDCIGSVRLRRGQSCVIDGRTNRRNEPIALARNGDDVLGLALVITEGSTQIADGLVHGAGGHYHVAPDRRLDVLLADDLARALREIAEDLHRLRDQLDVQTAARNDISLRIDAPFTEHERQLLRCLHRVEAAPVYGKE